MGKEIAEQVAANLKDASVEITSETIANTIADFTDEGIKDITMKVKENLKTEFIKLKDEFKADITEKISKDFADMKDEVEAAFIKDFANMKDEFEAAITKDFAKMKD